MSTTKRHRWADNTHPRRCRVPYPAAAALPAAPETSTWQAKTRKDVSVMALITRFDVKRASAARVDTRTIRPAGGRKGDAKSKGVVGHGGVRTTRWPSNVVRRENGRKGGPRLDLPCCGSSTCNTSAGLSPCCAATVWY